MFKNISFLFLFLFFISHLYHLSKYQLFKKNYGPHIGSRFSPDLWSAECRGLVEDSIGHKKNTETQKHPMVTTPVEIFAFFLCDDFLSISCDIW